MEYPKVARFNEWTGGTDYVEMTPAEYEEKLQHYREQMEDHLINGTSQSDQAYGSYLKAWFGDGICDGSPNYEERYKWHKLPMSATQYLWG